MEGFAKPVILIDPENSFGKNLDNSTVLQSFLI